MGRRLTLICLAVALLASMRSQANAQASLTAVLKECEKKTLVMGRDENRKLVKVGEHIGAYCQGMLEGILAILVRERQICIKEKNTSPDFLLSTVLTYRKEAKSQDDDAAMVIGSAYKRAFGCTN